MNWSTGPRLLSVDSAMCGPECSTQTQLPTATKACDERRRIHSAEARGGSGGCAVPGAARRVQASTPQLNLCPERDPLRERERRRPVDGVRLAAHVDLTVVGAGLAAAARLLLAAERTADLRARRADVHVGDAAV